MGETKKQLSMFGHLMCTIDGTAECWIPDGKCSECHVEDDVKHVNAVYDECWRDIVEKDGQLDIEQVKRELHDYHILLDNVPEVYMHITKDRMSKPNYLAKEVIAVADDCCSEDVAEAIKDFKEELKAFIDAY